MTGRIQRACSHVRLPSHKRNVREDMFVARHRQANLPPTVDSMQLEQLRRDWPKYEAAMGWLRSVAIDAEYYAQPETPPPPVNGPAVRPWWVPSWATRRATAETGEP